MDFTPSAAWLVVIHIAVFTPAYTVDISPTGGDARWSYAQIGRGEHKRTTHKQLVDVASPRRAGDGMTSPPSAQFLRFTERGRSHDEIRYNMTAFGQHHQFILKPERRFIAPSFTVEHFSGNQSVPIPCGSDLSHCFYRGIVLGDPVSSAVFDLCNGLRGVFKTRNGVYLVQPLVQNGTPGVDETDMDTDGRQHLITNHLATSTHVLNGSHCGVEEKTLVNRSKANHKDSLNFNALPNVNDGIHHRSKRETIFQGARSYPRYVELMVTVDRSMLDHYGSEFELKRYLQTIIGVVHDIFLDPKIGNSIEIVLTGIKILRNDEDLKITSDARKSLRRFCAWQYKQNVVSDADAGHYDTAVLITRRNICRAKGHCETLGLAELGTMCDPERSCSIVEDNGLGVVFTIAHELGHVFNIGHDAMSRRCLGKRDGLRVMAPSLNLRAMPWGWSSCSRQEITEFLEQGNDRCLMDKPQYQYKKSDKLPGEVYGPDMQCKLTYGKETNLCTIEETKKRLCRRLWCHTKRRNGLEVCVSHDMPWAEGSTCGEEKWCIHGKCVKKETHAKVNGGWSAWSEFSTCSRTCGGGVTFSTRQCNHPSPSHGGKFCLGAKKRFKSCNTKNCPEGTPNFREAQCTAFNGKREPRGSTWVPIYRGRQCQLFCERVGGGAVITGKVIDGTKCDEKKFDICVNGVCRLAGCDNVLNSRTTFDNCGVCGGHNTTCQRNSKSWHQRVRWGYNDVAIFHPGYSSIKIEQITPEYRSINTNRYGDWNFLVLLDERRNSILNGQYVIKSERKITFRAAGLTITYSGSRDSPELIKIDGKLKNRMFLKVLSANKVLAPKITYSYNIPVSDFQRFVWDRKEPWLKCSNECRGLRRRKLVCKRERDGLLVSLQRCDLKKRPTTIKENCNSHCHFRWVTAGKGPCQPGCGPGSQKVYFRCVKHDLSSAKNVVRSGKECKHIPRPRAEQPCTGRCDNVQWVYSKWSDCTKTCGSGMQTRKVTCVEKIAHVQRELPASTCSRIEKRSLRKVCNTMRCPLWKTGKWDRCSVPCGEGHQQREVTCVWRGRKLSTEDICDARKKPKTEQDCRMKACPHWEYDEWSDCSASCGTGYQMRLLRCVDADRGSLNFDECRAVQKPISRQPCEGLPQCDKTVFLVGKVKNASDHDVEVMWVPGDWGECTTKCGTGHQERELQCIDVRRRILEMDRCENVTKPPTVQNCMKYCGNWRFSDWTPCSSGCGIGTQRRQVKCFNRRRLTEDDMCDPQIRPPNIRRCSNFLCSLPAKQIRPRTSGRWKTGNWSKCSSECGIGTQRRQVKCFNRNRETNDKMCKSFARPGDTQQCFNSVCTPTKKTKPSGRWKIGSWSECSRTCANGTRRRSVICMDGFSQRDLTEGSCKAITRPAAITPCNFGLCPHWRIKQWSRCSKSCDFGTITRDVYCSDNKSKLREEKCNSKLKPAAKKTCYVKRCVVPSRWVKGNWNACSVKCGEGVKLRKLWCEDLTRKRIPTIHCKHLRRKPKDVKKCRRNNCGIWESGPWGDCSSKCNIGEQVRNVRCRRDNSFVGDESCPAKDKPLGRKPCLISDCKPGRGQYKWFTTDWTPCSSTCGNGGKSRMVLCVDEKEIQVGESNCSADTAPPKTMLCKNKECFTEWNVGDWSECSKSCGKGVQTRSVSCQKNERNQLNDSCDKENRPASERRCNLGFCDAYYKWRTGPWSPCSTTCGVATMRRSVKCLGYNNVGPVTWCSNAGIIRPDGFRKCKLPQCLPKTCKDIQKQNGKQEDNEFILTINNKKIKVFCHGMLTDHPKEFITLSSGPKRNFAEYYHRSLRNPNECPNNGARSDYCPGCHTENYPSSGGNYFSKVRIDISRMSLIGNDVTFAVKRGKHSPAFGTAGDCYSKVLCPQGRFSIDLTNTGLSLAYGVTWKSYGHNLSKIIEIKANRKIVTGMCGGYCGVCSPYRLLRVTV